MNLTLPLFNDAKILVIGDIMLDRYWHGQTSRISPEAPVPVVHIGQTEERPGGAGNVASNTATLGCPTHLLAVTGQDEAADALQALMQALDIKCHFAKTSNHPTITKLRVLSRHQQLIRLDFETPFDKPTIDTLAPNFLNALPDTKAIVLSDYGKGIKHLAPTIIKAAKAAQIPVLVDPKGADFSHYRGASIITPNLSELEQVVGPCPDNQSITNKGTMLLEELQLAGLLVTRGEHGMTLLQPDKPPVHLPTHAKEVFDVTGAGDTVISVFAAALGAGLPMAEAMALSNLAAGIVVTRLGAVAPTRADLQRAIQNERQLEKGVVDKTVLTDLITDAKAQGQRIVMTNGCFDLLHAGHVQYLERAKALGDKLVVAVNTDDSIKRLKGQSRPIVPLAERMSVLASLNAVDWVVDFAEDTPTELIQALKPDVLVKGADYTVDNIAGAKGVLERGGQVETIQLKEGCSTSSIIEKIKTQV